MPFGLLYEITDGVRRAKAAWLAGDRTIRANFYDEDDQFLFAADIELKDLRSPNRSSIACNSSKEELRWRKVEAAAMQKPSPLPPIDVVRGSRGVPIEQIYLDYGGNP